MNLIRFAAVWAAVTISAVAAPDSASAVTREEAIERVNSLASRVEGFRASLEVIDKAGGVACLSTSTIAVSRAYGFRTDMVTSGVECQIVTDFSTGYQYFPHRRQAMKMTADRPELSALFRKPATDMNPLTLLDPQSIEFKGEETFAGEPVYHFTGTTVTQMLGTGEPLKRSMEAWISTRDGLPRKTIERVAGNEATTIYANVEINPPFTPADFRFVPPPGVEVIDANEQLRRGPVPQSGRGRTPQPR